MMRKLAFCLILFICVLPFSAAQADEGEGDPVATPVPEEETANLDSSLQSRQRLYQALMKQDHNQVNALLAEGIDPNTSDQNGGSLLMTAVALNDSQLVNILLDAGADVLHRDNAGWDALCLAVFADDPGIFTLLLESGADPYTPTSDGNTPFTYALNYASAEMLASIINSRIDLNRTQGAQVPLVHAILTGRTQLARDLLDKGVDINAVNNENMSPLMYAIIKRNTELTALLLDRGADITTIDISGSSALHYALKYRQPDVATRLIEMGIDTTTRTITGSTPYTLARERGYMELKELLHP